MTIVLVLALVAQEPLPEGALFRLAGHSDAVRAVAWSPDGRFIATGSRDGAVLLWDASTGHRVRAFEGHSAGVTSAAWSPDGKTILSGSQDRTIVLWDVESGRKIRALEGHAGWIKGVAFSPDGKRALSAALDRTVATWDLESGKKLRSFEAHPLRVLCAAFSPDGRRVIAGNEDKEAFLFEVETGTRERLLDAPFWWNRAAAFAPDGRTALVCSSNQGATLFDVATGGPVRHLSGITGLPWAAAVGPDGAQAAIGTQGRTVDLFDLVRGRRVLSLQGHSGQVAGVAFSPGGTCVVSASEDGTAIVWNLLPDMSVWAAAWRKLPEEERRKQLAARLDILAGQEGNDVLASRSALIEAGDEAVGAILAAFPPKASPDAPSEERLAAFLKQLDDDDFEVRVGARRALKAFGPRILPWIDGRLGGDASLSVEVRNALKELRAELASRAGLFDLERLRAVLTLVEMRGSGAARKALERYASGGEDPYLAETARRATGK